MTFEIPLLAAVGLLAFANGSNDNPKGVATLYGSGTTGLRQAIAWATITTLAGSLAAWILADRLLIAFRGAGLVPAPLTPTIRDSFWRRDSAQAAPCSLRAESGFRSRRLTHF
jgi:hypothetical protein